MTIPAVTCDAKISVPWNEGSGTYTAELSAVATESPTSWAWTILEVPVGLEALLSGTWGDFVDGVATTGAGSSSAVDLVDIPTDTASGTIVVQCVATNGTGPSVPTVDRAAGQQCVIVRSEILDLEFPANRQYDWGLGQLDGVLRAIEADTPVASYLEALPANPIAGSTYQLLNNTWYDMPGLTKDIAVQAGETINIIFEGFAFRSGAGANCWIQFVVDGAVLFTPTTAATGPASTVVNIGQQHPHTFASAGTFTVKMQAKYSGGYGPWDLYDGRLHIIRYRAAP